jgi:hypothetical protein
MLQLVQRVDARKQPLREETQHCLTRRGASFSATAMSKRALPVGARERGDSVVREVQRRWRLSHINLTRKRIAPATGDDASPGLRSDFPFEEAPQ